MLWLIAERRLESGDAAVLFNCADVRDLAPDIERILEKSLRLPGSSLKFLADVDQRCQEGDTPGLFLMFDAVNEAKDPVRLLESIVDFAREITLLSLRRVKVRLVVSLRTESWARLKSDFRGEQYFYQPAGELGSDVVVHLARFVPAELRGGLQ